MSLAELRLEDLRCLHSAELQLDARLNLISGDNGSGKTSLLEAIYLLGRGRSFRTRHTEQLIRRTARRLWVHGHTRSEPRHDIALELDREFGAQIRLDHRVVSSRVELSEAFPVLVIDPGIHRLIEEGPAQRRRWLDWAVFHVEPGFLRQWQDYARALRQRNAALQSGADATPWEGALVAFGEALTAARTRFIAALQPHWAATTQQLDAVQASLGFVQGWSRERSLAEALRMQAQRDRERGATLVGPHRFDVQLRLDGRAAREVISRGQQKILGVAMALSMARYLSSAAGQPPTLLLDDPAAELDTAHTQALLQTVLGLGTQLVVTTLRADDTVLGVPDAVFHVERGSVKRL
ncbi:MAG: DNA replication/repair protein RecF [Steroidobacteraceae bacterium]